MIQPKYLLDSNIIISTEIGGLYDKECYPIHFRNFEQLIKEGKIISIDEVKDELVKYEEGVEFSEKYEYMFKQSISNETKNILNHIQTIVPEYVNEYRGSKKADLYLIAYAYQHNLCIVTQEKFQRDPKNEMNPKNYRIPTVCKKLGGTCVDNSKNTKSHIYVNGFGSITFSELVYVEKLYKS